MRVKSPTAHKHSDGDFLSLKEQHSQGHSAKAAGVGPAQRREETGITSRNYLAFAF